MARGADGEAVRPIVVKRVTIQAAGHHGGAWKVAYADFVTAMMAFFLLLWLLGATDEEQRKGIADYFSPTLVDKKSKTAGGTGLFGGDSITAVDQYPKAGGQTGTRSLTVPMEATGGPKEGASVGQAGVVARDPASDRRMAAVKRAIESRLAARPDLVQLVRQIRFTRTPDGLRIDVMDDEAFSMFRLGTTVFTPRAAALMGVIADSLKGGAQGLSVRGHTDGLAFSPRGAVNNWTLSTGRAEATRRELIRNGVSEPRFRRIEGVADREPVVRDDAADPRNRRVSIELTER